MRYRDMNRLDDFSHDVKVILDFIGEKKYQSALEKVGNDLRSKGFVTPFDDALFALELDLWNLERLRTECAGKFTLLPARCHAGVDFLLGLGQTIPVLSEKGKAVLLGRIEDGLDSGLWPLRHELGIAANLSKRGWDIQFHDLEEEGGFDFLVEKRGMTCEIEAKAISAFTGWPIKPENLNKLLVEIKQHFKWEDASAIPVIGATLTSSLLPDRNELQQLVSAFSTVAQTQVELTLPEAQVRFVGTIPYTTADKVVAALEKQSQTRRLIVLFNPNHPKLILEIASAKPIQTAHRIIRTVKDAAKTQFSRSHPAIIWTHVNFIPEETFLKLGATQEGRASFLDSVANAILLSQKRDHLSQLVFSGGSFLSKTGDAARSSYRSIVYDSPICRFGKAVVFERGRVHPDYREA